MKLISLVGARPQFVKEAVVGRELDKFGIEEILVHSGQHYDSNMSEIFFDTLKMKPPKYNLGIGSGTHAEQTGRVMIEFERILFSEKPDMVLVYGDTNTTLAGAVAASKLKIPVIHVEAGLRQEPKDMPEELNRVLTDRISRVKFCPSKLAVENLKSEGMTEGVYFVGDVMYDIFLEVQKSVDMKKVLQKHSLEPKKYVLTTLHRDFNTDDEKRLSSILGALSRVSEKMPVILPIHPRTVKRINEFDLAELTKNLKIVDPIGYDEMVALTSNAFTVVTDSGGLQKESYFAHVPGVVMMPDTSWIELVESGWNVLSDADREKIVDGVFDHPHPSLKSDGVYGHGDAASKIAGILSNL